MSRVSVKRHFDSLLQPLRITIPPCSPHRIQFLDIKESKFNSSSQSNQSNLPNLQNLNLGHSNPPVQRSVSQIRKIKQTQTHTHTQTATETQDQENQRPIVNQQISESSHSQTIEFDHDNASSYENPRARKRLRFTPQPLSSESHIEEKKYPTLHTLSQLRSHLDSKTHSPSEPQQQTLPSVEKQSQESCSVQTQQSQESCLVQTQSSQIPNSDFKSDDVDTENQLPNPFIQLLQRLQPLQFDASTLVGKKDKKKGKLFTYEEVLALISRAVTMALNERDEQLADEFNQLLQKLLDEKFEDFSQYCHDSFSKPIQKGECSYVS